MKFSALKISSQTLSTLDELGFQEMTEIQSRAIPLILEGRDLIGESRTGSGKTLAFGLPLLEKIEADLREVQALIICPTRELCAQVTRELRRLGRGIPMLQILPVTGGEPMGPQLGSLRRGAQVVVATPGRWVDLLMRARPNMESVKTLVLDEADRMLEMGFQEDMETIIAELPVERQTLLFSATYPATIQKLSRHFQKNPAHVVVKETADSQNRIEHSYFEAEPSEKLKLLSRLLRGLDPDSALVFCNLKATTLEVAEALRSAGFSAEALNGDLEQDQRNQILARFRNGSLRFLIATDVAARGLDIQGLPLVINFDLPRETEVYVHRVGRTGRAGQTGRAISLISALEKIQLTEIQLATDHQLALDTLPSRAEASDQPRAPQFQTLMIAAGRKDKVRPGDLLGALTGEDCGLAFPEVGKIEIHDFVSYVAVLRGKASDTFQKLRNGRIKGKKFIIRLLD